MRVLDVLGKFSLNTVNLFFAVITSPYGSSMRQLQRRLDEIKRTEEKIVGDLESIQKFHSLLHRLKKDGLIKKAEQKRHSKWFVTKKGKEALLVLKERHDKRLPSREYKVEEYDGVVIVIFDIPERHRDKRYWLREQLKNTGFKLLQKSVWLGHVQLPEEFVNDLRLLNLTSFVHIFSVSKSGSIEEPC